MPLNGAALDGEHWEAAFELLFETSATPVAIVDERRCLVDLNVAAQRMLGHFPARRAGASVVDVVPAAERERSAADWEQLLRHGRATGTCTLIGGEGQELKVTFAAVMGAVAGERRAVYTLTPASSERADPAGLRPDVLTRREEQVIRLIAEGLDTAEIAEVLHVSPNTVRSHVRNAMSKLSARTRAQLVARSLGIGGG